MSNVVAVDNAGVKMLIEKIQPPDPPDLPLQQEATMSAEASISTSE